MLNPGDVVGVDPKCPSIESRNHAMGAGQVIPKYTRRQTKFGCIGTCDNLFNQERHLVDRQTYKERRLAALTE